MFQINNLIKIILTLTHITFLISCHTTVVKPPQHPVKFEKAVSILANDLLKQIENEQNLLDFGNNKFILLEPFNEAFHGDIIKSTKKIEEIIIAEGKKNFSQFTINKMESQQLDNANYLISGIVHYQLYKDEEFFRNIQASVIDLKKSTVVANSKVWISKDETGSEPALDRIMDMREASDVKHIKRATSPPGTQISLPDNYLKIKALLSEATTAYLAQDYNHAFYLFNRATQGNDEQLMEAYAGVYQSSMALGEQDKASEAYRKLIQISINNMNKLSTLFLFEVNKITFPKDHDLEDDFSIWLREIGHYLKNNDKCFIIEGHSSKTGEAEYNRVLSQRRAAEIQRRLQVYFPAVKQKTKIIGKGFDETIIGLGTDDAQDELDRRVEFEIIDCKELKNTDTLSL